MKANNFDIVIQRNTVKVYYANTIVKKITCKDILEAKAQAKILKHRIESRVRRKVYE